MRDSFGREVNYLRISVTDLCNLRCVYCMPKNGVEKFSHSQIITPERIKEVVEAGVKLGINKIRLTGGEPLVRKGFIDIVRLIKSVKGVKEICVTTNGITLKEHAKVLYEAGVDRLNISLDTLDETKYQRITRGGQLNDVVEGIKEAKKVGFKNIKVNCVLIGSFNDDEIVKFAAFSKDFGVIVRFIELMPIGESEHFDSKSFISNNLILSKLPDLIPEHNDGVTNYYHSKDNKIKIGLISPLTNKFCDSCSRIRLTSDGKIKPCLHSTSEFNLKDLNGDELVNKLKEAILAKPKEHRLEVTKRSDSKRGMSKIGG